MLPNRVGTHPAVNEFQKAMDEWHETEEIQLRDYLEVIMRRKWLIVTVLALVFYRR